MSARPDLTLYGHPASANSYRVRLILHLLELPYEWRIVDLASGAQRDPSFLAISPAGQVPALADGGLRLWDSHAIAIYLVERYGVRRRADLWPTDPAERALVSRWIYFDANEIHNGVGTARNVRTFGAALAFEPAASRAATCLGVLEERLADQDWLELDRPTLADLCCYPLVSVRSEAGVEEEAHPNIVRWTRRIEGLGVPAVPSVANLRRPPGPK